MPDETLNRAADSPAATTPLQFSFRRFAQSQAPDSRWGFGFACITGAFQLEFYQSTFSNVGGAARLRHNRVSNKKKSDDSMLEVPKARIKISLPTWCSSKIIETLVYRTQVGWSQLLRTRSIIDNSRDCYSKVARNIQNDDLDALKKQFDQRQVTPWDELGCGWNFFSVSGYPVPIYSNH